MDDAYRARAAARRETMIVRVARSAAEAQLVERERDDALEPHERAEAIWPLVCELAALRGIDASELRLDRSVGRLERRKG